jgi:hypothetical protein
MLGSEKKNLYIGGLVVVVLVVMYFLHSYQTKRLIHDELKNIAKEKKKRLVKQMIKRERINPNQNKQREYPDFSDEERQNDINMNQQDMDSYIDPGNDMQNDMRNDERNDDTMMNHISQQPPSNSGSRISGNNIMMRDMMDGSHQ